MVIGERFAWGHLEKTAGDATVELFLAVPELIRFADPTSSAEKHTAFPRRAEETRGKLLALNLRRLPSWMLSKALHQARYGAYPDYEPLPMLSPQQMAESTDGDRRLLEFTGEHALKIDRWLRTEFLVDDFLAFVSELTEVPEARQREIRARASVHLGTPLAYDHRIEQWFTPEQITTMYEHNPVWAALERELYGPDDRLAAIPPARPPQPHGGSATTPAPRPLTQRELLGRKAERVLAERARRGDSWTESPSPHEQAAYERQCALLENRRYGVALELGCGAGLFTRRLAGLADRVVAIDVAPLAIARARTIGLDPDAVEFRLANALDYDVQRQGPWDLVVMSETIWELGWLYPLFDVAWFASEIFAATRAGGRFLMANTYGGAGEPLLRPWLIDTYRDLFLNVGFRCETEETVAGTRDGLDYRTLITVFSKPL